MGDKMLENNKIFSKVFMWMFIGLLITFGTGYFVSLNVDMLFSIFSKYYGILIIAELLVVIFLSAMINKMQPITAKIMFCLYSFLTGLTFSSVFVVYQMTSIIYVFGITSLIFLVFSLIGYFTKIDLTKFGTYLLMALFGIIICGIVNMFVGSEIFDLTIIIVSLIVFICYVAYDIQVIKRKLYMINDEEKFAIIGALELYLDFINIFLKLIQLFGKQND